MRGVLNDAISLYFADATLASAFVARWCVGSKVETAGGVFQVREDGLAPLVGARLHRTPRWEKRRKFRNKAARSDEQEQQCGANDDRSTKSGHYPQHDRIPRPEILENRASGPVGALTYSPRERSGAISAGISLQGLPRPIGLISH